MDKTRTYEELEQRVRQLEKEADERRRAEKALRESEEKFRLTFENAVDAIFWADPGTGLITNCNKAAETLLEKRRDEIIGQHQTSLHPPDTREYYSDMFRSHIERKGSIDDQAQVITKSGKIIPVHISASVTLVGGKPIIQGIFRDITEGKRAEEALRESQERYRRLWDDAPVAYHMLDTKGIILQVNQTEMNMLGYARDEMVGKPIFEFIYPEQRRDAEERFGRKLAGLDVPKQDDRIYIRKDSSTIYVSIDDRLERDTEGRVVGIRTTMVDVSKRKQAEDALRESEKKYSTLVENSLTGIYIDQDEKIVFANNKFAEIYRYQREELIGIETRRLVHPEDRPLTERMRKQRLSGQDVPSDYEARGLTKDGETIWVKRRNSRIEYLGRPAVLGNIVDITEQKEAEEELRKTNEELKNFAHVVSHDLKTPIISIQGFSARLLKSCPEQLGENSGRYISQIQTSARRMEVLVSDLLTLSTIGRVVSAYTDVSSLDLARRVAAGLGAMLKDKGIELAVAETLPEIRADEERIYQVFENLLVNAIKYMGDVENPKIEVGYEDGGRFHRFYVRDNGIGIDPKYRGKIFEMFYRLREIEGEEGTGLGLAIVKRIVNNHGGRVWVESEKGKGAVFYFALPKAPYHGSTKQVETDKYS
jgi:PAS domain S-box-containing protein